MLHGGPVCTVLPPNYDVAVPDEEAPMESSSSKVDVPEETCSTRSEMEGRKRFWMHVPGSIDCDAWSPGDDMSSASSIFESDYVTDDDDDDDDDEKALTRRLHDLLVCHQMGEDPTTSIRPASNDHEMDQELLRRGFGHLFTQPGAACDEME